MDEQEAREEPDEPDEVDVALDELNIPDEVEFLPAAESPPGESYDSVEPEEAGREWLLRATETQAPRRVDPAKIRELEVESPEEQRDTSKDEQIDPDLTVRAPSGFFSVSDDPER